MFDKNIIIKRLILFVFVYYFIIYFIFESNKYDLQSSRCLSQYWINDSENNGYTKAGKNIKILQ